MKYIDSYKIFEADKPLQPGKWSWSKDLTIPYYMQQDLYDMSWELRDMGYNIGYQWWPPYEPDNRLYKDNKYPNINITKTIPTDEGGLEKLNYEDEIKEFFERIKSYLNENDYNSVIKFRKVNSADYHKIEELNGDSSIHFRIDMISKKVYGDVYEKSNLDVITQSDIYDIIQELIDTNKIRFGFNEPHQKGNFLMIRTRKADVPLYWNDISDYVLRVIDYLGDRFAITRIRKHPNYRKDRTSNINTEPDYIDIDIDENTNIDFGLWSIAIKWN